MKKATMLSHSRALLGWFTRNVVPIFVEIDGVGVG